MTIDVSSSLVSTQLAAKSIRTALARADKYQQQAFDIITGSTNPFDLSREDPKTLAMYDTSGLFKLEEATKWFDMKRASNLLGKQMLLARRLCEAGCGFVTVSDCGWDMHANNNSPKNMEGLKWLARRWTTPSPRSSKT